ncbi:MAG TPA: alpha/beta fold hydrolase [Longimicrobium sp.]
MEIAWETRRAGDAPLLLAVPPGVPRPMPAVLWFHGLSVDKETHRKELEQIARAGFLAVGVDAAGHGERRLPDLDARIDVSREETIRFMLGLVEETAREVPAIVRALMEEGLADPGRVAAVGISMGGYLLYRSVVEEPSLRAAVAILGSPEWPEGDSPHRHLDAFRRTALLSITAEHDENVPPGPARALHRRLGESVRAHYLELPGAVHLMCAEDWERTMDETLRWLALHNRISHGDTETQKLAKR